MVPSIRSAAWLAMTMLLVFLPPLARAQVLDENKLTPADALADEDFGAAVALDGSIAAAGAPRDNDPIINTGEYGAAYVFRYDGSQWVEEAKLTAPQRDFFDWYGWSVAVDGDVVLVGTRNDEDVARAAGAVYVYRYDGSQWTQEAKLTASDGAEGDHFSRALALEGDVALVGAALHDASGFDDGAVYVYRYDGSQWIEEAKLTASDPANAAYFGESVAISGTRVLIGAWGDSPPTAGQNAGMAYVFEYDGSQWQETAQLAAADASLQAQFGLRVALDGDRALIGAPLDDELGAGAGAAYVFHFDGSAWSQEAKLMASDHSGFNLFGSAVALDGTQALVGAENWFPAGEDATGKAYLFTYDEATATWQEQAGLVPGDAGTGDNAGSAVALDGGVALVGAPEHNLPAAGAGAAYVYGTPTTTAVESPVRPRAARLSAAYPNPFTQQTHVTLTLAQPEHVRVSLFDLLGREVRVLHDGVLLAQAPHAIAVPGETLPSGLYLVRAVSPTFVESKEVILHR